MPTQFGGIFLGSVMLRNVSEIGGNRGVFVKLQGNKNDLVFPPFGGVLKNPFKGSAKIFAGDLVEYRTNSDGLKPELYLLKTYEVAASVDSTGTSVEIVQDGFRHIPFVGDILMKAPSTIGGTGTAVTVTAVAKGSGKYTLTLSATLGALSEGDILVEAAEAGSGKAMLVQNVNAFAPCDYEMLYDPALDDSDIDNARYMFAPVLHGTAFISKMSPVPACVAAKNKSLVNGWFEL